MDNFFLQGNYNQEDVEISKSIIRKYSDTAANNNFLFQKAYKTTYSQDYSYLSLKRSNLIECQCKNAHFKSSTLTGSTFQHTLFYNCDFLNASLDFCLFYNCDFFSNNQIVGANFSNTNVINSSLSNILFDKTTVSNTLFEGTTIDHCTINYSSFENSTFNNCYFKNMELRNLNLEFVEFRSCKFVAVTLPFSQVPYTFGLLECLENYKNNIWISSKEEQGKMTIENYIKILPQLIPYYIYIQEYFPATNIYIFFKEYDKAFNTLMNGVQKACMEKDFRMLKYFCKLAINSGWCDRKNIKKLYNFINEIKNFEPMTEYEQHNYYLHLGDFRKILFFGDETLPTLYFHLQTNINSGEEEKLIAIVRGIDNIINAFDSDKIFYSIELHHESPYDLLVMAAGIYIILKLIAEGIHCLCIPIKDMQELKLNQQKILLNEQEVVINKEKIDKIKKAATETKETMSINEISVQGQFYFTNYFPVNDNKSNK